MSISFGPPWAHELAHRRNALGHLRQGYYHFNYVVNRDGRRFLLRIPDQSAQRMDLRWLPEAQSLRFLEEMAFPAPRLFGAGGNPEYLLLSYVEGQPLSELADIGGVDPEAAFHRHMHDLAGMLRSLHKLDAASLNEVQDARSAGDICDRLIGFATALLDHCDDDVARLYAALDIPSDPFAEVREQVRDLGQRALAFCHGDAHPRNCIVTPEGELVLIDWELAMLGDPMYDVAVAVHRSKLDAVTTKAFVAAYDDRLPDYDLAAMRVYHDMERIKSAIVDAPRTLARVEAWDADRAGNAVKDYWRKLIAARRVWLAPLRGDPDEATMLNVFGMKT
jgi:aminoglycoside phosphotransferase (APT) family kinase protein